MATPVYSVTLHHLAPGATAAGLAYTDELLPAVSPTQLRELLLALSEVAARLTIYEPSSPEIRVKTDRDVFVIRTRNRRLCFVGWESILRGEEHSVSYILTSITGTTITAEPSRASPKAERLFIPTHSTPPMSHGGGLPRWAKMTALVALIIGFNATTVWMLMRPKHVPVPKHEMLAETESHNLLTKVAGTYQTGIQPGDRQLIIDADGTLRLAKFGLQQTASEERTKSVRGALLEGRAVLITSDPSVLIIKDADTVVLYGSTYRRRVR